MIMTLKGTNTRFVLICAGIATLALGGFGYFTWTDMQHMEELDQESFGLETAIRKADAQIRTIPSIENRVLTLREQVKSYVTILPDDAEIHAFVDMLTQFETESGVRVTKLDDTQARADVGAVAIRVEPENRELTARAGRDRCRSDRIRRGLPARTGLPAFLRHGGTGRTVRIGTRPHRGRPNTVGQAQSGHGQGDEGTSLRQGTR